MTHVGGIAWIMNKEPAMVISGVIAAVGLSLPYLVVPIRRSMGLPTYQWDSDTNTNPFISEHSSALKKHEFNDAKLLAAWSKDSKYRYHDKLEKSHAEFPDAKQRLAEKGEMN